MNVDASVTHIYLRDTLHTLAAAKHLPDITLSSGGTVLVTMGPVGARRLAQALLNMADDHDRMHGIATETDRKVVR